MLSHFEFTPAQRVAMDAFLEEMDNRPYDSVAERFVDELPEPAGDPF